MVAHKKKIFVLDTSVLLFDHNSLQNFQEHDVALPITVLEELDKFKVGNDTKNYEAREVIRFIDKLSGRHNLNRWISLGEGKGRLKIVMSPVVKKVDAVEAYASNKNDHRIINAALSLKEKNPGHKVTLVTKDINLRIKSKALGLPSEDYETGKIKDIDAVKTGQQLVVLKDADVIGELYAKGYTSNVGEIPKQMSGAYAILKCGKTSCLAYYNAAEQMLERVEKSYVYGVKPKNSEQTFAVHALLNPAIKLIALQGVAGTGKTLLALASALEQSKKFKKITLARPIVPLSNKDLGYLPGDAKDKIGPYMQPLVDNMNFIKSQFKETEKKYKSILDMEESGKIEISPLAYIRGRSLSNIIFIIDEAQNLTPHEVKTIITRAGEGTKIIFTGDIHQIDTPYLDDQSNGLAYLIDRLKGQPLFADIRLEKGERSELANLANELL